MAYFAPKEIPMLMVGDAEFPGISAEKEAQIMSAYAAGAGPGNIVANFGISAGAADHFYNKFNAQKEAKEEGWLAKSWDSVKEVPGTVISFAGNTAGDILGSLLAKSTDIAQKKAMQTLSPNIETKTPAATTVVHTAPPAKQGMSTGLMLGLGALAIGAVVLATQK